MTRLLRSSYGLKGLAALLLLLAWEISARLFRIEGFPPASTALAAIPDLAADPQAVTGLLASLARMAVGFATAAVVGVFIGIMMGRSAAVEAAVAPLLMIFYPVPKAALMPLLMLWLGIGDLSKTFVIALGCSIPIIYHSFEGARSVEPKMLWSASAMGMSRFVQIPKIVLPASMPDIFIGLHTGLILAFITMVTSEMIVRQSGIGNILFNSMDMARYDIVYGTIVVISVIGLIFDFVFRQVRQAVLKWSDHDDRLVAGHS
ncbi:MAG: ABC transporter permease [Rhizobiaceae bacterium]